MATTVSEAQQQLLSLHRQLHQRLPECLTPAFDIEDGLHLLMIDSMKAFESLFPFRDQQPQRQAFDDLLALMETFLIEDDEFVTNAVYVSFVENLLPRQNRPKEESDDEVIALLPPLLGQAYLEMNVPPSEHSPLLLTDREIGLINQVLGTDLTADSATNVTWSEARQLLNRCFAISESNRKPSGKPNAAGKAAIEALRAISAAGVAAYGARW